MKHKDCRCCIALIEQSQLLPKDLLRPSPKDWNICRLVSWRFALELALKKYAVAKIKTLRTNIMTASFTDENLTRYPSWDVHALPQGRARSLFPHVFHPFSVSILGINQIKAFSDVFGLFFLLLEEEEFDSYQFWKFVQYRHNEKW